jgi:catechol 2,3-dioxygenase-like lactoylglutathione lyase family enzyme
MELGAFSVSLSVRDLAASQDFYGKLGFEPAGGDPAQNWLILRNGDHVIGLFQGMFERNMLTFNPGWDQQCNETDSFTDVREIQATLKKHGLAMASEADETSSGPGSFMVIDPDGNPVLVDQHR